MTKPTVPAAHTIPEVFYRESMVDNGFLLKARRDDEKKVQTAFMLIWGHNLIS